MQTIGTGRAARWAAAVILLAGIVGSAPAQTNFTWTGGGGNADWFTSGNWDTPGFPGVAGSTGNTDRALFDTAGTTVTATNQNSGFNLGAIATTGASGGLLTAAFSGNGALQLNGGYTIGSFTNVAAAAQNGRDLLITETNMSLAFGTPGTPTTFYADAGRILTLDAQQINNTGGDVNKEGPGTLAFGIAGAGLSLNLNNAGVNVNGGTLAAHQSLTGVTGINVATGAALQAGLSAGDTFSLSAPVAFADDAGLQIVTDGASVSQLQNAALTKGADDTFNIVLTGLNPTGTETFTPNGIVIQASSLTGFDPNGTYTEASPGRFTVSGNGFLVTSWSLTVQNNNQVRLDSMTITPIPEPAAALAAAVGLAAFGAVRRRRLTLPPPGPDAVRE